MDSASPVIKRSIVIGGHKTSVSIEDEFWLSLKQIASERQSTLAKLVQEVDAARDRGNLSSAIRVYVLRHYRQRCGLDGEHGASDINNRRKLKYRSSSEHTLEGRRLAGTSDHFEAWVRGGPNGTPLICSVIDLRPEGATLVTPDIALPDKFTLLLLSDGSLSRACKVVSRQAYTVKVEFVGSGRS